MQNIQNKTDNGFQTDYPELEAAYDFASKAVQPSDIDMVVSHGNCSDGFMSRTIVEKAMRADPSKFKKIEDVLFVDGYHGSASYASLIEQMRGRTVLICDFSFKPDVFAKMIDVTNGNILILDHHATAREDLDKIDPAHKVFDMSHSGAFITWVYMNGFSNIPKAVLYVEDNDLWAKKLPNTLEFTAYMFLQPFAYESYVRFFEDSYIDTAFSMGVGCVTQNNAHIETILKSTRVSFMEIRGRYYFVPNVNCAGILISELGNNAMKKFVHANFAMLYKQNIEYSSTTVSLRSLDDRTDCSYIAQLFGGGGHRNASGLTMYSLSNKLNGRVLDEYRAYGLLDAVYSRKFGMHNVLMLNTSSMRTSFANYLMQERFVGTRDGLKNKPRIDADLPPYQEGMYVMRNNLANPDLDEWYSCSAVWSYASEKGCGKYSIVISCLPKFVSVIGDAMKRMVAELNLYYGEATKNPVAVFAEIRPNKNIFYVSFIDVSDLDLDEVNKSYVDVWNVHDFMGSLLSIFVKALQNPDRTGSDSDSDSDVYIMTSL